MKKKFIFGIFIFLIIIAVLSGCGGGRGKGGSGEGGKTVKYTLNIAVENGPGCSVAPASGSAYSAGTVVGLVPAGLANYVFHCWGGPNGAEVVENKIVMNGNKSITAVFIELKNLTVEVEPDGAGSVAARLLSGTEEEQTVELTAIAGPGYEFSRWSGGLSGNPATITLTGPTTVTVYFESVISGQVAGKNTGRGISGITITAGERTAVTDSDGYWKIKGVSFPVTVIPSTPTYLGAVFSPASETANAATAADIRFGLQAYEHVWSLGESESGERQFLCPNGVAVDGDGNIYVADTNYNRIRKFSSGGFFQAQWGSLGSGEGEFDYPHGVAVDGYGNIYVADTNNHRIQKFSAGGVFQAQWGSEGSGEGEFAYPLGVAVDGYGNSYVVDTNNYRIQKFSSGGLFQAQWGSKGSGEGEFNYAHGVAVDRYGISILRMVLINASRSSVPAVSSKPSGGILAYPVGWRWTGTAMSM